ncbi:MAG: DUF58 domain-containing protein [Candidatus Omnitrophota bacterium]|nr:DUF58 domain-containing protein [Candidatus Omnitrophota bacterium]MBU1928953.1 DUF58 domain-containing protein [Candidatus Omnitrophota bacterium]MBU2034967.1 DUF58 domain-containing protein [Candidatus Omnitrophota bacterium]MBU2221218.1 DUF58 domain-containing protein [Candidatus Omnitrophota bacterium]MBU2257920.1 DUF58 domain-containing protein [Candidatus Omnitrophota bacterium]
MFKRFINNWLFIAIIILASLIIGLRTGNGFFYFFFWFLLSTMTINLGWLALQFFGAKIVITRKNIKKINEDESLEIEVSVENKSFLPVFNPILQDDLSCAALGERQRLILLDYLKPRSTLEFKYTCVCPQRGRYRLGPLAIYFFDPQGIFYLKKVYPAYSEVYVYPKTFPINNFPPLAKGILPWFGINTSRTGGDDDEFFGIREYRQGDPIKRIHWASTARHNKLIVKQFQNQNYAKATIIFNLEKDKNFGEGKESIAEYTIKIAASVVNYLTARNIPIKIMAHTGEVVNIPFNRGEEHLEDIMKFLAGAQVESRTSLAEIFEEFSRFISNENTLIVIALDKDWQGILASLPLDKRNISIVPLILLSSTFLYPGASVDKEKIIGDEKFDFTGLLNFNPLFFSRGDNLTDIFTK